MFDGRASSDLAVLLPDLRCAPLGDEWAEFTAEREAGRTAAVTQLTLNASQI